MTNATPSASFNPLPSQKQGETLAALEGQASAKVSIRSPHKSKGRQGHTPHHEPPDPFQSAPLTKARGDPYGRFLLTILPMFQSAPLTKARGDPCRVDGLPDLHGFNPLPSQKQGETREPAKKNRACFCFNPLPSQKQGETPQQRPPNPYRAVSIRSPHKSKGRPAWNFNWFALRTRFNPLPSQKQGETETRGLNTRFLSLFQSAPLTKARGDAAIQLRRDALQRFNPLPSQKQGET